MTQPSGESATQAGGHWGAHGQEVTGISQSASEPQQTSATYRYSDVNDNRGSPQGSSSVSSPATAVTQIDDYDTKYPEDAHGQEFAPNSRVYNVYLEEATKHNTEAIDSWKDSLDVLLIFAGLFSAVVTTFVVEASSSLQPDYAEINAYLQVENNALLRAISSGTPASDIPVSPRSPEQTFAPSYSDTWVNGLWYLSLTLSLGAALITVLVKQWLKHYASFIPGSPQDRARLIEARRRAADFWRLTAIVGILPLLMHASVFVFLAGLALLLSTQNIAISITIICVICLTGLFYVITTILPLLFPHCSYVTPLTLSLYATWCSIHTFCSATLSFCGHIAKELLSRSRGRRAKMKSSGRALKEKLREVVIWQPISYAERMTALQDVDLADVHILQWLQSSASLNPSVPPIICEAISGVREGFTQLSAIRRFSGLIIEDWETEIARLMVLLRFSRVERYLRMNAVLYAPNTNSSVLRRHPSCIDAIVLTALKDKDLLHRFWTAPMNCCEHTSQRKQGSSYSDRVHTLLLLCTMGLKGSEAAGAPKVRLHPGAWVNLLAYIVDFARTHSNISETTVQCIQTHASVLLRAVLNHHYEVSQDRQVYFAERRTQDNSKSRVTEPVSILELPPGHSRTRLLQFLYVYSRPIPGQHEFNRDRYTSFPSFIGNMVELWHKALLLNLKQYEVGALPVNVVGVLQELAGVLQMSTFENPCLEKTDLPPWTRRLSGSGQSALELEVGKFMWNYKRELKEVLVQATLDVLIPKDRNQMPTPRQPTNTSPHSLANPSVTMEPSLHLDIPITPQTHSPTLTPSSQTDAENMVIIQLVWLTEVLLRDRRAKNAHSLNVPVTGVEPRNNERLEDVGKELLKRVIRVALTAGNYGIPLDKGSIVNSPGALQRVPMDNAESSAVARAESSLMVMVLAELNRFLATGSDLFVLIDGVGLVYDILTWLNVSSTMRRAQSLLAIFRALQMVGSFLDGVLKKEAHGDASGRTYLSRPETLKKCCEIMVRAEFAIITLNASGVNDASHYALLSRLRQTNRQCLNKWWEDILTLTNCYPNEFRNAWKDIFKDKIVLPCRPAEFRDNPPAAVALYKKRHCLWVEDIKKALSINEEKEADFKLSVAMLEEEYDRLPPLTRWRHAYPPVPWALGKMFEYVEFDLVKDHLNENLDIVASGTDSEVDKLLNNLEGILRWPAHNLNENDVEAGRRRPAD